MAPIDEDRELDALRTPVVEQRVDRGAHGPAREQDVVDEHDRSLLEVEVEMRGVDDGLGAGLARLEVVAVEGDVEVAERHLRAAQLADQGVKAGGQDGAAGVDPDQRDTLIAGVLLDDLVRDPHQGAAQIVAVEDDLLAHTRPFLASLDRVKGTDESERSKGHGYAIMPA